MNTHHIENFLGIVWDTNIENKSFKALALTCKNILFHPVISFSKIDKYGGFKKPFYFALIMDIWGTLISILWLHYFFPIRSEKIIDNLYLKFIIIFLTSLIWLFIGSGLIHFFIVLFNGKNKSFKSSFRVVAYSLSTHLLLIFPFYITIFISLLWNFVVQFIGIREVFQMSNKKTLLVISCSIILAYFVFKPISFLIK